MSGSRISAAADIRSMPDAHQQRNSWLVFLEVLTSISLVSGLFYVAFFVKLSSNVPVIEATPFGNRDNYFEVTLPSPDSNVLWAVGRGGRVIRSEDGGEHWNIQTVPVQTHLQSIAAWDPQTAIVIGDHGVALLTENGGGHWRQLQLPIRDFGEQLLQVITDGNKDAWLVGRMGTVMYSDDRGHSWSMRHPEEDLSFNSLAITPGGTLWVVGEFGQIRKSTDKGLHWHEIDSPTANSLMGVAFSNEQQGIAVGLSGTVLSTQDGGVSWQVQRLALDSHLYTVAWVGDRFAAVGNGAVLLSGDADKWNLRPLKDAASWYTSIGFDANAIYLSGSNLLRLTNNNIHVFSDRRSDHYSDDQGG